MADYYYFSAPRLTRSDRPNFHSSIFLKPLCSIFMTKAVANYSKLVTQETEVMALLKCFALVVA